MTGNKIKIKRTEQGLTQQELADKMHVSRPTISSWETGRTEPTYANINQLAQIFSCTTGELIDDNEPEDNKTDHNEYVSSKDTTVKTVDALLSRIYSIPEERRCTAIANLCRIWDSNEHMLKELGI